MTIGFIGFGEAATAIVAGWHDDHIDVGEIAHFDIIKDRTSTSSISDLTQQCETLFSTVTAASAEEVAQQVATTPGMVKQYFDLNSVSPEAKRRNAKHLASVGISYVDVAVMAPIYPHRHKTPMLISVDQSSTMVHTMTSRFGFNVKTAGENIGRASTIKMLRSIMVKGVEALTDELMRGCDAAGVTQEVLASLEASRTERSWPEQAAYNIERMETHGQRRGDEMSQVVQTLRDLGVSPLMTERTVQRQYARAKPRP